MAKPRRQKRSDPRPDDALEGAGVPHPHGTRAAIVALVGNILVTAAKIAGTVVTGSSALLAESIHSVADTGHQVLVLAGGRHLKRAARQEHPLGYGRERYFWSFVVALVLFTLGAVFSVIEGLRTLDDPMPLEEPRWAFAAVGFAIVIQVVSLRTAARARADVHGPGSTWQFIRRARSPELPVVLVESAGALVSLALALAGITATVVTDDGRWDGYAALGIGAVLAVIALLQAVLMRNLLVGTSASRRDIETIRAAIEVEPDVLAILHLTTHHLGPDELLVVTKIEFLHELTVAEVAATIDRVERTIRTAVPAARLIYVEPDVHERHRVSGFVADHAGHIDPADPHYEDITGHRPEGDDALWSD